MSRDWLPLGAYEIDDRSGEGPQVELTWRDEHGEEQTGVGTGFRFFDANAEREVILFASGGLVRRPIGFRAIPTEGGDDAQQV